ncbi:hypothetical protein [Morganella morganii]|uniref:Uncharacterized protein n=1 Tax=Morganella morganii TaxID=582 RepID=A0A9Q4CMN7_MORMO|nr:hypothetical protein [Morganella morganii]BEP22146.1 hypothetical protein SUGSMm_29430 [Morganella morganii subsp. sibonii]HDS6841520.1 hypothetical protein [Morganella morganii subsp. morganii]EJD6038467.1 hypothetical protein [Morganella morganii]EKK5376336.1 hypothetical protein [Morganella morganii]EKK5571034.1 hypothetical protein [Morganella morganii]
MKELNQEQLLFVSGAGLIAAGTLFSGIIFDITAVMMSDISGGREEIVFADHKDISRLRYEVI